MPPPVAGRCRGPVLVLMMAAATWLPPVPARADQITPAAPPTWQSLPWDRLLAANGLDRHTAQLNPGRWRGGGRDSLPLFDALWDNWFLTVPTARKLARQALQDNSVENAARLLGIEMGEAVVTAAREAVRARSAAPGTLADAIAELHRSFGRPLAEARMTALYRETAVVPHRAAAAAALLLFSSERALIQRNQALAGIAPPDRLQPFFDEAVDFGNWGQLTPQVLAHLEVVDQYHMSVGALELQTAIRAARKLLAEGPRASQSYHFAWDTPLGKIALKGDGNDTYGPGDYLLIIDTGGDDTYAAGGGTPDAAHPVSLLLDMGGNDTYRADRYAFGAGILGYGFLYDGGGDDSYEIVAYGEGTGVCGVGVLEDLGGQDSFRSVEPSQGAGIWGLGLLTVGKGNTTYRCYALSQGYGGTRGVGILADAHGDDLYECNDTDLRRPSPQTAAHNTSMAQGAGYGRRGHFAGGDGLSLAGGLGLLVDGEGNDRYSGGVFCQGVAYWYALGFLVDMQGSDTYRGAWYSQGACAHYAVAAMVDAAGDDAYTVLDTQGLGHGRDSSVGVFLDARGNDTYIAPCSLGSGNINSVGVFVELAGNDEYQTGVLGQGTQPSPGQLTLGLFFDGGGTDQLSGDPLEKPNSIWVRKTEALPDAVGIGMAGSW